jgi:hypothetical protein
LFQQDQHRVCMASRFCPCGVRHCQHEDEPIEKTPPLVMRPRTNASFRSKWRGGLSLSRSDGTRDVVVARAVAQSSFPSSLASGRRT